MCSLHFFIFLFPKQILKWPEKALQMDNIGSISYGLGEKLENYQSEYMYCTSFIGKSPPGQQIRSKSYSFQNANFLISQQNPMMLPIIGIVSERQFQ